LPLGPCCSGAGDRLARVGRGSDRGRARRHDRACRSGGITGHAISGAAADRAARPMKAVWRYDDRDLGPATEAVRAIIARWLRIDWFVEPAPGALDRAHAAFEHHLVCTRRHDREAYARDVHIAPRIGTWAD